MSTLGRGPGRGGGRDRDKDRERERDKRDRSPISRSLRDSADALKDDDSGSSSGDCDPRGYNSDEAIDFFHATKPSKRPPVGTDEGKKYRFGRYASDRPRDERKSFSEWERTDYRASAAGGRPGRGGGPPQRARRMKLKQDEGYRNVENVKLGEHYPDMVKDVAGGSKEYVEVGIMNLDGTPCAREAAKLKEEIPYLNAGDKLIFVGTDGRRVTYYAGESASLVDTRSSGAMTQDNRQAAIDAVVEEMKPDG